jgi:hypothetical protein
MWGIKSSISMLALFSISIPKVVHPVCSEKVSNTQCVNNSKSQTRDQRTRLSFLAISPLPGRPIAANGAASNLHPKPHYFVTKHC